MFKYRANSTITEPHFTMLGALPRWDNSWNETKEGVCKGGQMLDSGWCTLGSRYPPLHGSRYSDGLYIFFKDEDVWVSIWKLSWILPSVKRCVDCKWGQICVYTNGSTEIWAPNFQLQFVCFSIPRKRNSHPWI